MASIIPLIQIAEPGKPEPAAPSGFALFELGFRPFYLLGSGFAAVALLCWLAALHGAPLHGNLDALAWHQHEMVFGFAFAVITGFTLTAGRVWTGHDTLKRGPLAMLALHWVVARVALVAAPLPIAAVVDVSFPFILAGVMARVMLKSGDRHNLFIVLFLALFGVADGLFFAEQLDWLPRNGKAVIGALYLVVMLVTLIGGRVIPSFTANAVPGAKVRRSNRIDLSAILLTFAAFIASLASAPGWSVATLAGLAGAAQVLRQSGWAPLKTLHRPILWILHLSYAWIPVGLLLLAASALGWVPYAAAVHAFGVGVIGGMIIAMITRTALGHTGRPLRAGALETTAYALVHVGAVLRLLAALAPGLGYTALIDASGLAWIAAFVIYFACYLPRLYRPRVDGKPG